MKYRLQYILLVTLALCFTLHSCGLEEMQDTPQNSDGYIEFVARPVGFNNQVVDTKAEVNDIENKIENCFFLLFDATTGNRISIHTIDPSQTTTPHIKIDVKNHSKVTACFLANVPSDFAYGIIGTTKPSSEVNPAATNNQYLNTAVLSGITYGTGNNFGLPLIDLDGTGDNDAVSCIPMFGVKENISLSSTSSTTSFQVPIYRLFSKVSIDLRVDLSDLGALNVLSESFYDLRSCTITNIPTAVSLYAPAMGSETPWANIVKTDNQYSSYFTTSTASYNKKYIYNDDSISSNKSFTCDFYVPEYYLNPLTQDEYNQLSSADPELRPSGSYGTEMYKPLAYSSNKSPVFVKLTGIYDQIPGDMNLTYNIYLGENASNNFTLKRNTWYKNYIKIKGFSNADVDHRVTISGDLGLVDIHGEVANCYIVSEPREYSFFAYKGAHKYSDLTDIDGKYKCTKGTEVKILYKDSRLLLLDNDNFIVSDDDERGVKKISFTVDGTGTTWSGNIVIALVYTDESGNEQIEWSWHLWFVPEISIGTTGIVELGSHTMPDERKSVMMNRNLGITTTIGTVSAEIGAYYKYGYKEPYFDASKNVAVSEGNSTAYKPYGGGSIEGYTPSWSSTKSVTDPCPPGYRVPSSSVWSGYIPIDDHSSNPYSFLYYTGVNYPYSGYLDGSNGLQTASTTSTSLTYSGNPIEYKTISSPNPAGIYRRYRNITYKVPLTLEVGYIHGSENTLFYSALTSTSGSWLENLFSSFDISDLEWQEGSVSNTGSWLRPNYVLTYPSSWKSLSEIGRLERVNYETAKGTVIKSALQANIQSEGIEYSESELVNVNNSNRYQVRCVKE